MSTTTKLIDRLRESRRFIESKLNPVARTGIILGSGLGPFADELAEAVALDCRDIPHYPVSTVEGHAGRWVFGKVGGVDILAMQGRVHAYEGYSIAAVTYPIHLMAEIGIRNLIITNAAGAVNSRFQPGDLMLIVDHINLMFDNPLFGPNDPRLGPRFPDMSEPYSRDLIALAESAALELGIPLRKGVLVASKGPAYETAAEVEMYRRLGGDAATMSTVPEVIAAVYRGVRVLGISCITNLATGLSDRPLSHEEVVEVGRQVRQKFAALIKGVVGRIGAAGGTDRTAALE
jgi:purine-nucleoside phosphorylase